MTNAELVPYNPTTPGVASSFDLAPAAWTLAQRLADTDFVPTALRRKPEAVLAAMLTGNELGIGPMQALAKIHVIEGRPSMSAELMRAVIQRAGHEIWLEETTTTKATIGGRRVGTTRETKVTWTLDDAKRAGLDAKQNWRRYPRAMLIARATGELARALFADVLAGISYTTEELTDGDVLDTDDVSPAAPAPAAPTRRRRAARAITTAPAAERATPEPPPLPDGPPAASSSPPIDVEETPGPQAPPLPDDYDGPDQDLEATTLTWAQRAAIKATNAGLTDDHRHGLWLAMSGGRTNHAGELDGAEKNTALAALVLLERGEAALAYGTIIEDGLEGHVWALVDNDGVRNASATIPEDVELELVAPPKHAGKRYTPNPGTAQTAATPPESPQDTPPAGAAPTLPNSAPDGFDPTSEDAWRRYMRARGLRVSDVIRVAVGLTPAGTAKPGNLAALAALPDVANATLNALEAR